jgi:hypothetical protein
MIPKKQVALKTQLMISAIAVTGNIVEYVEREKIDLIVRKQEEDRLSREFY